jgi:four helix bundle protein
MHQYKKLDFYNRSIELCLKLYQITKNFPDEEKFGLTSQLRRSGVSVCSNIAEGASRSSNKDFGRFLEIALGSSYEIETQLYLSFRLDFVEETEYSQIGKELEIIIKQIRKFKQIIQ